MKISIVVPAFNEERGLAASLQSIHDALITLDESGISSELIVCDNNSSDRTAAIARVYGADVVFEPINQISRARNTGAARATGDWLVFIDADSHPSRELFADTARAIRSGRYIAGGSTMRFDERHRLVDLVGWSWNTISRVMKWGAGSFIFCEASTFHEIGGFSQELFAAEEIDLFRRLKQRAYQQRRRDVVILHRHPLVTSVRKMRLYTWREQLGFVWRTIATRGRTLKSRSDCFSWYDGRR